MAKKVSKRITGVNYFNLLFCVLLFLENRINKKEPLWIMILLVRCKINKTLTIPDGNHRRRKMLARAGRECGGEIVIYGWSQGKRLDSLLIGGSCKIMTDSGRGFCAIITFLSSANITRHETQPTVFVCDILWENNGRSDWLASCAPLWCIYAQ
jgi:hypothetical protein